MSFRLFKKGDEEIALILDVGSASVGAGIVSFKKNVKPQILYNVRHDIPMQEDLNHTRFTVAMISALGEALSDIAKHMHKSPLRKIKISEVFCVLSSAWSVSKTQNVHYSEKTAFKVTKRFVEKIIAEENSKLKVEMSKESYANIIRGETDVLDEKVIQTKLNGYETSNPYDKYARELDVTLFTSISSKKVTDYISEAVDEIFNTHRMTFHSFSLIGYSVVSDLFRDDLNYILIDVTGEITDVSLIKNGSFIDSVSFPRGRNTLLRKVAEKCHVGTDVALTYVKLVSEGGSDEALEKEIFPTIEDSTNEWVELYKRSVTHFDDTKDIPSKIFLTVDEDVSSVFSHASIKGGSNRFVIINRNVVEPFVDIPKNIMSDTFINIESIFLNKVFHLEE